MLIIVAPVVRNRAIPGGRSLGSSSDGVQGDTTSGRPGRRGLGWGGVRARARQCGGHTGDRPYGLPAGLARPDVPALAGRPGADRADAAGRRPPRRVRRSGLDRPGPVPDGADRRRLDAGAAVSRHVLRDERPDLLGRRAGPPRRRLPLAGRRAARAGRPRPGGRPALPVVEDADHPLAGRRAHLPQPASLARAARQQLADRRAAARAGDRWPPRALPHRALGPARVQPWADVLLAERTRAVAAAGGVRGRARRRAAGRSRIRRSGPGRTGERAVLPGRRGAFRAATAGLTGRVGFIQLDSRVLTPTTGRTLFPRTISERTFGHLRKGEPLDARRAGRALRGRTGRAAGRCGAPSARMAVGWSPPGPRKEPGCLSSRRARRSRSISDRSISARSTCSSTKASTPTAPTSSAPRSDASWRAGRARWTTPWPAAP